ncbi:GNAT family N-acetyltransferase [Pleomorphomonas sp. NRK KF1]|uniref:GNAT family N-acetyltransferase n=1 Tax=Pleomorphomonas sp. NRK KF1 TaxID=2943000 RepID=UPI0020447818|nr:GNAT family N-acyltransferase [Pleomorphomonas sp. NRK KF1]MCM5553856.1 GNAT family N-acetyltransferase [Pleomorphomonas sp. NRK KF1]
MFGLSNAYPARRLRGSETGDGASLGYLGALEVRLARTAGEVRAVQALRYRVFYGEMQATADPRTLLRRRDADAFDRYCDHLLVLDHDDVEIRPFRRARPCIVGTYRLLRQKVAERHRGFYTAGEFSIEPLLARHAGLEFLELGRSCVMKAYRSKRTVELLWQGIWAYVLNNGVDAMIGCASFEGTDPNTLALPLSFLHHHASADTDWLVEARPERAVSMNRLPIEAVDMRAALAGMPPLIKGYLRLGAMVGRGAVVDHPFGTTDVMIVLPVDRISERYVRYYGADASRHVA